MVMNSKMSGLSWLRKSTLNRLNVFSTFPFRSLNQARASQLFVPSRAERPRGHLRACLQRATHVTARKLEPIIRRYRPVVMGYAVFAPTIIAFVATSRCCPCVGTLSDRAWGKEKS